MFSNSELSPQSKHENINIFKIIYEIKVRIITVENFDNVCDCFVQSFHTVVCFGGCGVLHRAVYISFDTQKQAFTKHQERQVVLSVR